ncbi:MAG: hypothetical protein V1793_03200 [Pseudomonadota bacterium]
MTSTITYINKRTGSITHALQCSIPMMRPLMVKDERTGPNMEAVEIFMEHSEISLESTTVIDNRESYWLSGE